jgi:hypothetical protein
MISVTTWWSGRAAGWDGCTAVGQRWRVVLYEGEDDGCSGRLWLHPRRRFRLHGSSLAATRGQAMVPYPAKTVGLGGGLLHRAVMSRERSIAGVVRVWWPQRRRVEREAPSSTPEEADLRRLGLLREEEGEGVVRPGLDRRSVAHAGPEAVCSVNFGRGRGLVGGEQTIMDRVI